MADSTYTEALRPQFHFSAKEGWLNDPNGLVFYKGEYHLFFQHNPFGTTWGNMTWGHAVSDDLVHWRQLENALEPDSLGTMFSGSAIVDWDNTTGFQTGEEKALVAIYTAAGGTSEESKHEPFTQCLAFSNDCGQSWQKYKDNPVQGNVVGKDRDPKVIWHEDTKRWIIAMFMDEPHHFALFASKDLKSWEQLQTIDIPGTRECPDFYPLVVDDEAEQKWIFTGANGNYILGDFDGETFTPETDLLIADWGENYYAVQNYSGIPASDGRCIQIAWMKGGHYPGMPFNQQMNFPNELKLKTTPRGVRLFRQPAREIETLYTKTYSISDMTLVAGQNPLADIEGELLDIELELELLSAPSFSLHLNGVSMRYSAEYAELSCLSKTAELKTKGTVSLRVLLDKTSIELFADKGETCMSFCFLPRKEQRLELSVPKGEARLHTMQVRKLKSAWR